MNSYTYIASGVILFAAFYYGRKLLKLSRMAVRIKKAKSTSDILLSFPELSETLSFYDRTRTIELEGEKKTTYKSEDFFTMGEFARAKAINLKHINSASGILAGLGVLGTFLGLTFGVSQFHSDTAEQIAESIKLLMGGMGTAFFTSLLGMGLSIIYIWCQKKVYNSVEIAVLLFTKMVDSQYYISPNEVVLMENQKSNAEVLERLNLIKESLTTYDEEDNGVTLGTMIFNLYEESEKQSQALESFTTDLSNELNASLGKTMNASIVPLIQNLERSHETMNTRIEDLSNNIQSPATDLVSVAIKELQSSMLTMTNEFRDTISGQTIGQMEALATNLAKTGEMMDLVPQTIKLMSDQVAASFADVKSVIQELQTSQQQILPETMQKLTDKVSSTFNEVSSIVSGLQTSVASQQEDLLSTSHNATTQLMDGFKKRFEEMAIYQKSILDEMNNQLQTTVGSLTEELSKALNGISEQQNHIANSHVNSTRETERLLQSFAKSILDMQNANHESSNMLLSIQRAGENLNSSTDKLKDLSTGLGSVTENTLKQQAESIEKFETLQEQNQRTIEELSSALESAQNLLTTYSKDFETIKGGLNDVFKGIEEGLKDYSATLRESTGGALAEYSDAMTKSTAGLKNIAEALSESAEELCDGIDKIKKMR